jgi:hypothetical protein
VPEREALLERSVLRGQRGVRAQPVAKREVVAPQRAAVLDEMQVVRARIAASEVVAPRDARLATVHVARALQRRDVGRDVARRSADQQVEDRLRHQPRHRRAAHVLDLGRQVAERGPQARTLVGEARRPRGVVLDQPHLCRLHRWHARQDRAATAAAASADVTTGCTSKSTRSDQRAIHS